MNLRDPQPGGSSMPGWIWLLPVASALLLVLVGTRPLRPQSGPTAESALPEPVGTVTSWTGGAGPAESGWSARLTPLQLDPSRQTFDSHALRRALRLPEALAGGEPWRLELELGPESDGPLDLAGLGLADASGAGPRLLGAAETEGGPGAPSALRALFRLPAGPLEPGAGVQVLLWGPEPEGRLELTFGDGRSAELFAGPVGADELPTSLAGRGSRPGGDVR